MSIGTLIATAPLAAMLLGGLVGLAIGYWLSNRIALRALAAFAAVCLVLLIYLATVGQGEEARAFPPFVALTGGLFPALFGGIPGWVAGKALRKRRT